jgi:hypothetical protein
MRQSVAAVRAKLHTTWVRDTPRRPNRRGADVAGENGAFSRHLVEHPGDILRMDRPTPGFARGQVVKPLACFLIMLQYGLQVAVVSVLEKPGGQGCEQRGRSHTGS